VYLEFLVQLFNLANKDELHTFQLLDISVFSLFTEGFKILRHLLEFGVLLISDGLNHLT